MGMLEGAKGWNECTVIGSKGFVISAKLRAAKNSIKKWLSLKKSDELSLDHYESRMADLEKRASVVRWSDALRKERIEVDFMNFIVEFHSNSEIVREVNNTFITLVPKCVKPETMSDFRPKSLVGSIYKVLAKVLANRVKKVMNSIINEFQMAFVKGRKIMDSFVIVEEIIHGWKKDRKGGLLVKLDFVKACDSVNHNFLDEMMGDMGFGENTDVGYDQMASFGDNEVHVSHLQFTDDTILFLDPNREYLLNAKRILRCFELASGLKINFHKSCIARIEKEVATGDEWAAIFKCKKESRKWDSPKWYWEVLLRRPLFGWEEDQWRSFKAYLEGIPIWKEFEGTIAWCLNPSGQLSVGSFRRSLKADIGTADLIHKLIWQNLCPPKVELLAWQILHGRVMVKEVMYGFGFGPSNLCCPLCNEAVETTNHLFLLCKWTWMLWIKCLRRWDVVCCINNSVENWNQVVFKDDPANLVRAMDTVEFCIACKRLAGPAGMGGVLRDWRGKVLCLFSCFLGTYDANAAKIMAIWKACDICVSRGLLTGGKVVVASDSKVAVSWVNCEDFGNLNHL
ncbi:hypothetical protein Dsin_024883 [Dipteronia sinensis]|uniref:Reverse transcriptase domain-containing protein n=1 Tax=Dipteronia sinensis TaxID=43782 RepID=A0AAD9ZWA3_9ROSI|nr:hypothetical protein Dsin_024883 [Dipteronia sinensis]